MPQRLGRLDALIRVEGEALLEQVDKVVEVLGLGVVHASRGGQQTGAEVAGRFDDGEGSDGGLLVS